MRLFFAVDIGDAQRSALHNAVAALQAVAPRAVRWVEPRSAHITLAFLGEVDAVRVGALLDAARAAFAATPPLMLQLAAAGVFPNLRRPRTFWLGITSETNALAVAQRQLADALAPLGFPPERRPFRPHLTLGRVREEAQPAELAALVTAFVALPPPDPAPWQAERVVLYQSELGPQGARYSAVGKVELA